MSEKTPRYEGPARTFQLWLFIDAVIHRWKMVLVMMLVVPAAGIGARYVFKPKVKMSAQILVQESVKVNPFLKDMMVEWSVKNRLPLIAGIVRSRGTLERVLLELDIITPEDTEVKKELAIRDFRSRLDVYGEGGGLIRISVVGRSPDFVYKSLKLLTATLIDEMLRPQKQALDESVGFLDQQVKRIRGELANLEEELKEFKKKNAGELPEVHRMNLESHLRLVNAIMDTESSLVAAQQKKRLAAQRLMRYDPETKKLQEQLAKAEKSLRRLLGTYTAQHPGVRTQNALVTELQNRIEARKSRNVKLDLDIDSLAKAAKPYVGVTTGSKDGSASADIIIRADDVLTSDLIQYQAASSDVESLSHKLKLLHKREADSMLAVRSFADNEHYLNRLVRDLDARPRSTPP